MEDNRKIAIYSRKSKFTGKGDSINNQIEMCKNYATTRLGITKDDDFIIFEDEGFSGANVKRPRYQDMLKCVREKKISTLLFYRLDRCSRNVSDFCDLKDELEKYDTKFYSVSENFDNVSPMGKAMMMITSVFAELERNTIAERIRDNMLELSKSGRWLGGVTPIGFKSEKIEKLNIDGKKRTLYKLSTIDEEINIVKLIFNKFIELKSQTKLETYLLQNDIKTKNNKNFSRWGIKNILTNPVYATADYDTLQYFKRFDMEIYASDEEFNGKYGIMSYNKTTRKGKKKIVTKKDIKDWVIAIGKHEGTILGKDWVMAQDILSQNENKMYRKPLVNKSFLSGMLRCSNCGSLMIAKVKNYETNDGSRRFDYICDLKMRSKGDKCQCKNINGNETDKLVLNGIKSLAKPSSAFYKELLQISKQRIADDKVTNEISTLESAYAKNNITIKNLAEKIAFIDNDMLDEVQDNIRNLKQKNAEIRNKIKELSKDAPGGITDKETADLIIDILDRYVSKFDELDIPTQRNILKMFVGSIKTDGEKVFMDLVGTRNHTHSEQNVLLGADSK